jgi:AAA+ superfamily predicted ATPase
VFPSLSLLLYRAAGIKSTIPPLHHVFTGNPGTGKTTVAMKMGELYREMGFINVGHTVQATRADLVGQYIGHTGPKTKEMITRSFGGILFIDEAYGLYKEDSRDYGSEVIEMLGRLRQLPLLSCDHHYGIDYLH